MSGWTQAICERDWIARNAEWDGGKLVSIRRATTIRDPESPVEQCCYCGEPTIWGAFIREDPATVPFPRIEVPE